MKNKDSILAKIWLKIICILVAPAAVIHIAYQVWYFKNYMIKGGPKSKPEEKQEPQ